MKPLKAHIFPKAEDGWYCEPEWVSKRLLEVEDFPDPIYDPACGQGTILKMAKSAGHQVIGSDIVDRGHGLGDNFYKRDFLTWHEKVHGSLITNPPFDHVQDFCEHALNLGASKIAIICLVRRLNAAHWLQALPLQRVYLLTPRPSMPPGSWLAAGNTPGGGTQDFCWLVFDRSHVGPPNLQWLHRYDNRMIESPVIELIEEPFIFEAS